MIEMTHEQKNLFNALTRLQQEIALNSISGMSNIDSYKASSGKAGNQRSMESGASEILRNREVILFIDSMKETAVSDAVMSRAEMMAKLTLMAGINVSDLTNASLEELTEYKDAFKIKSQVVHTSMKQLADLAGYDSPRSISLGIKTVLDKDKLKEELGKLGFGRETNQLADKEVG